MIVAGFGFRTGVSLASLRSALAQHGAVPVTHLATAWDKVEALAPLAREMGLPLTGIGADQLAAITTRTLSHASLRARGTGSVAEAAALAAAGVGAQLLFPRQISTDRMATCAIACTIAQGSLA